MSVLLELKNVSKSFGGIRAVQKVSFNVNKGEILGLIGPNGSGKSTCVNLITGIYMIDDGEIIFDNKKLTKKDSISARTWMGMGRTFQTPRPFGNLSVFDNVYTIALQRNNYKDAVIKTEKALEMVNLLDMKDALCTKLSIEKRKWLDLARVLVNEPRFIMMDECMAGLNPVEMEESLNLIRKLNKEGITILFIEHVMRAVISICSRVVVLNEGKLLCEGEPREVLRRQEVIDAYLGGGIKNA